MGEAGLWVGACGWVAGRAQAYGVFYLPGFGLAVPAPWFLGTQSPLALKNSAIDLAFGAYPVICLPWFLRFFLSKQIVYIYKTTIIVVQNLSHWA